MKRIYLLLPICLLCAGILFYQWQRANQEKYRLAMQSRELSENISRIKQVLSDYPGFAKKMKVLSEEVELLSSRLPLFPDDVLFVENIIKEFAEKNIRLVLLSSLLKNKDFYQTIEIRLSAPDNKIDEQTCREIFGGYKRLVHWWISVDVPESTSGLKLIIYTVPYDFMPVMKPCPDILRMKKNYWPFNSQVREVMADVEKLCSLRKREEGTFNRIKEYEIFKQYRQMMVSILQQLDPDWLEKFLSRKNESYFGKN